MLFDGLPPGQDQGGVRGPCYSACTLLLDLSWSRKTSASRPAPSWRFTPCAARNTPTTWPAETRAMYETYPPEIRRWIDHNGGWQNLPIDGFWTMYDHSLWALGYPRCAP